MTMHLLAPIAIAPRPCEYCGLTVDRHRMVDNGEGPEFFCLDLPIDDLTLPELERRAELRIQEEVDAILARWEAIEPLPAPDDAEPRRYRTPQATIDAFKFVVARGNADGLRRWLAGRPKDAPFLLSLLESRSPC